MWHLKRVPALEPRDVGSRSPSYLPSCATLGKPLDLSIYLFIHESKSGLGARRRGLKSNLGAEHL